MDKWIKLYEETPPFGEEVFLKIIETDEEGNKKERVVVDKLVVCWATNAYGWSYGDYSDYKKYEVDSWMRMENEDCVEDVRLKNATKRWISNQIEDTAWWYEYKLKKFKEEFDELNMGVPALTGANDCRKEYVRGQISMIVDIISELKKRFTR